MEQDLKPPPLRGLTLPSVVLIQKKNLLFWFRQKRRELIRLGGSRLRSLFPFTRSHEKGEIMKNLILPDFLFTLNRLAGNVFHSEDTFDLSVPERRSS